MRTSGRTLSEFFTSIEILRPYIDYLEFRVAGETRRIWINPKAQTQTKKAGITGDRLSCAGPLADGRGETGHISTRY